MKFTALFALLLFITPFHSSGQENFAVKRDSLHAICSNTGLHDTLRAKAYSNLCYLYFSKELDSVPLIANKGIQFIQNVSYKHEGQSLDYLLQYESSLYLNAGVAYYKQGQLDSAIVFYYECLKKKEALDYFFFC